MPFEQMRLYAGSGMGAISLFTSTPSRTVCLKWQPPIQVPRQIPDLISSDDACATEPAEGEQPVRPNPALPSSEAPAATPVVLKNPRRVNPRFADACVTAGLHSPPDATATSAIGSLPCFVSIISPYRFLLQCAGDGHFVLRQSRLERIKPQATLNLQPRLQTTMKKARMQPRLHSFETRALTC